MVILVLHRWGVTCNHIISFLSVLVLHMGGAEAAGARGSRFSRCQGGNKGRPTGAAGAGDSRFSRCRGVNRGRPTGAASAGNSRFSRCIHAYISIKFWQQAKLQTTHHFLKLNAESETKQLAKPV